MVQGSGGLCLAAEASDERGVGGVVGAKNLDGHSPGQAGVVAQMYLRHSSATNEITDLVTVA